MHRSGRATSGNRDSFLQLVLSIRQSRRVALAGARGCGLTCMPRHHRLSQCRRDRYATVVKSNVSLSPGVPFLSRRNIYAKKIARRDRTKRCEARELGGLNIQRCNVGRVLTRDSRRFCAIINTTRYCRVVQYIVSSTDTVVQYSVAARNLGRAIILDISLYLELTRFLRIVKSREIENASHLC